MKKLEPTNKKQKCRLCLSKPMMAYPITADNALEIESVTSIKLNIEDPIFNVVCHRCNLDLIYINKILSKFRSADDKLKQLLEEGGLDESIDDNDEGEAKGEEEEEEENIKFDEECDIKSEIYILEHEPDVKTEENDDDTMNEDEETSSKTTKLSITDPKVFEEYRKSILEKWMIKTKITPRFLEICGECGKRFTQEDMYKKHVYNHQRTECHICKAQITRSNFKKHVENHTAPPCVCEICGATAKNYSSLRGHMFYVHGNSHTCEYCGREFRSKYALKIHTNRDHLKTPKDHICEVCGKSFYTKHRMSVHHKITHEKKRPFGCQYCKKNFSSRNALKTHERQHTNETPYKCEVCGEGFRQKISLRCHRKSKHNIVEQLTAACEICKKEFPTEWALYSHTNKMHHT